MKSYDGDGDGSSRRDGGWQPSDSSVGGGGSDSIGKFPKCRCDVESAIYTSKTNMNPNRQFFGCSFFKERKPHCRFFCWVDEWEQRIPNKYEVEDVKVEDVQGMEHSSEMDQIQSKLNEMQLQIKELQLNMKEMELKMKEVMGGGGAMEMMFVFVNELV